MITRRDFLKATTAGSLLASVGKVGDAQATVQTYLPDMNYILEEKRRIPVAIETELLVIGGSSRAIEAAVAAKKTGCEVCLITHMPYLGDDICGSFLYDLHEDEKLQTAISRKIFESNDYPTPLHVKTVLENELIDHDINFLYCSYVTNAVMSDKGEIGGVVIANRSGRQIIRCKAVIDATHTASVAELFGVQTVMPVQNNIEFQYSVLGNQLKESSEIINAEVLPKPMKTKGKEYPIIRYTFKYPLKEDSYASLMDVEHKVRSATWDPDQVDSSDLLWYISGKTIKSTGKHIRNSSSMRELPESSFKPENIKNLWVLGPVADIDRILIAKIMRPASAMFLGEILGEIIGRQVKNIPQADMISVLPTNTNGFSYGQIGEILQPLRAASNKGYIDSPTGALPILGEYDTVVLGGGTAGAVAGLSASKHGTKTLVLEYLHGLGGLTTLGLIGRYWDGFREGFSFTIDRAVTEMASPDHPRQLKNWQEETQSDWKQEWYRREILQSKGEIWFGVIGIGAVVENKQVKGVVVATPYGRGVVLSKVLIDSSGSADIAIAAGASFDYTGKKTLAVQGAGMGKMDPGDFYVNNDWLFIDDTDVLDVSRVFVQSKNKFRGYYDIVKLPQTRERRRVIGEHVVSVYDVINHRRYSDTISFHKSSFDTHGMIVDPFFMLSPPMARHTVYDADVPFRSLLPIGLDGILVTGLGASAHRDAMPIIRMQPCLQNQGYAVGYLSALAVKENKPLRKVNIKQVQRHLVDIGNLPQRVLTDKDFKGYNDRELQQAAVNVQDDYKGLEILLTDKDKCIKILKSRINKTSDFESKVVYASILCMLGDSTHISVLNDKIQQYEHWDKGWHYTGMHQFGMSMSRLDALITALGNAKNQIALPTILEKARLLEPEDYFSHFRAVGMATESINDKDAIPILAEMLTASGVRYYSIDSYKAARNQIVPNDIDVSFRNKALKELHIARALYLCGDKDGLGEEVLKRYATSLQGHYARYANEILSTN